MLFCDSHLRTKLHYAHVDAIELGCGDCSYDLVEDKTTSEIVQKLHEDSNSFFLTDPIGLHEACTEHAFIPNSRTILLTTEKDNHQLQAVGSLLSGLRYVLGAPSPSLLRGLIASVLEFHLSGQIRGIVPRLIKPDGLHSKQLLMKESESRSKIQELVIDFFTEQIQIHKGTLVTGISSYPKYLGDIVDEFLMNAIWDAHPTRRSMDRSTPPAFDKDEQVEIECLCDGSNLSLSVTDHHGTFPASAFSKPIRYALGFKDETQLNEGPGGAGLGLLMTLQKVAALSLEVEAGQITRSVAVLRGDQPLREMQKRPRSVMIFEKR